MDKEILLLSIRLFELSFIPTATIVTWIWLLTPCVNIIRVFYSHFIVMQPFLFRRMFVFPFYLLVTYIIIICQTPKQLGLPDHYNFTQQKLIETLCYTTLFITADYLIPGYFIQYQKSLSKHKSKHSLVMEWGIR